MARSNKPAIWLPFAAGGTLAAFVLPALMLGLLLASLGIFSSESVTHERLSQFISQPFGMISVIVVLALPLVHAAHRLRMTLQDLGVRRSSTRRWVARACYAVAGIIILMTVYALHIL